MSYDRKLGDPGDYFFHYTTREAAFEHILPKRQLRLSPALRDPLESSPAAVGGVYEVPGDPDAERAIFDTRMRASAALHQLRRCSKVLSLTIDARDYVGNDEVFGRGWARARLWEQYAENHQGVCLLLRRDEFKATALEQLRKRSPDSWADEVSYNRRGILDNEALVLSPGLDLSGPELAREHLLKHRKSIFFTKLADWESEHEYRFVEASMDGAYTFVDILHTLAGVILGSKFPDWQKRGVFAECERVRAQAWQMTWLRNPRRCGSALPSRLCSLVAKERSVCRNGVDRPCSHGHGLT